MKTQFTPGPWMVWLKTQVCRQTAEGNAHGPNICIADTEANARLIAAAPELLEALQAALPQIERHRCTDPNGETVGNPVIKQARAAIARATGKEP